MTSLDRLKELEGKGVHKISIRDIDAVVLALPNMLKIIEMQNCRLEEAKTIIGHHITVKHTADDEVYSRICLALAAYDQFSKDTGGVI